MCLLFISCSSNSFVLYTSISIAQTPYSCLMPLRSIIFRRLEICFSSFMLYFTWNKERRCTIVYCLQHTASQFCFDHLNSSSVGVCALHLAPGREKYGSKWLAVNQVGIKQMEGCATVAHAGNGFTLFHPPTLLFSHNPSLSLILSLHWPTHVFNCSFHLHSECCQPSKKSYLI